MSCSSTQVPSLGVTLSEDNVNLDRELVAHGVSNIAAGLLGTVGADLANLGAAFANSVSSRYRFQTTYATSTPCSVSIWA
jgi:SulP family sulfate permease